jgi:Vacuolar protein sorting-associated protein 35
MYVSRTVFRFVTNILQLYRDGKRVLECLQRALRVSDSVVDAAVMVELFVEVSVLFLGTGYIINTA